MNKNLRLVLALLVVFLVVPIGWGLSNYVQHHGLAKITIKVLPADSTVMINDRPIKTGSIYLKPGDYTFVANRKDFASVKESISVKDASSSRIVYLLPIPNTAAAFLFLKLHPEIQQQREAQEGAHSAATQVSLTKKYPIISKLPAYTSHYRIDYSLTASERIGFSVTLYAILNRPDQQQQYQQQLQQYKDEALQYLKKNGVDPSEYSITYSPSV